MVDPRYPPTELNYGNVFKPYQSRRSERRSGILFQARVLLFCADFVGTPRKGMVDGWGAVEHLAEAEENLFSFRASGAGTFKLNSRVRTLHLNRIEARSP